MSIGLALSGGGFRATLFHLGVIAFLRNAGKLSEISHVTSVSGGSILAAHLVLNWEAYTGSDQADFDRAASELIAFVQRDVRGRIYRRAPMHLPFNLLSSTSGIALGGGIPFLRTLQKSTTDYLVDYYSILFGHKTLAHLRGKGRPAIYLLATNQTDGTLCSFTKRGLQEERARDFDLDGNPTNGFQDRRQNREFDCAQFSLARAVAASSAFPGLFPPVLLTPENSGIPAEDLRHEAIYLTDGGVYDNLGLRKFHSLIDNGIADVEYVVVSDASAQFKIGTKAGLLEPLRTSMRAADILSKRIHDIELRYAAADKFKLVYIGKKVDPENNCHALDPVHQSALRSIRTDLDKFSDLEVSALARHGYCSAQFRLKEVIRMSDGNNTFPPWDPMPNSKDLDVAALRTGQLERQEEIRLELDRGGVRKLRLLSLTDPISYVHLSIVAAVIAIYFLAGAYEIYTVKGNLSIPEEELSGVALSMDQPAHEWYWPVISSDGSFSIYMIVRRGQVNNKPGYVPNLSIRRNGYDDRMLLLPNLDEKSREDLKKIPGNDFSVPDGITRNSVSYDQHTIAILDPIGLTRSDGIQYDENNSYTTRSQEETDEGYAKNEGTN